MIIKNLSEIKNTTLPIIIIGSGPAGISTAIKLEKNKIKSLILEAGGLNYNKNSVEYLKGNVVGDKYPDLSTLRVRQFGGTSALWGGNCNPFREDDFDEWPIKLNDINKYENEAKEILNLKNEFFNEKFSNNLRYYNLSWSNVRFGEKYLDHIKKSKYIHLSLDTNFLNFNGKNKKIDSLKCLKNENFYNLKAKFYILSCGGIENSRLMLWSKQKNKSLISNKLPIGKYYMNHPYYSIGEGLVVHNQYKKYFLKNDISNNHFITCKNQIYISANKNFLKKNEILNSGIYVNFKISETKNNFIKQIRCVAPNYFKKIYEDIMAKNIYEININTLQEQKPEEKNAITLGNDLDPSNIPFSKIHWKRSSKEKISARLIAEELGEIFVTNEIGRIALNNYLYDDSIEYYVTTGNHQLGGTRMGDNLNDSVVDQDLKVHDLENLFINGSSIFRSGGHCHPTFTIIKLSLRLADHIKKLV